MQHNHREQRAAQSEQKYQVDHVSLAPLFHCCLVHLGSVLFCLVFVLQVVYSITKANRLTTIHNIAPYGQGPSLLPRGIA